MKDGGNRRNYVEWISAIAATLVALPALVYGSGFFMWIGPSTILYGRNLAYDVSARALLVPGIVYLVTLAVAAAFAFLLGAERLVALPDAVRRRFEAHGYATRCVVTAMEIVFWLGILQAGTALSGMSAPNPPELASAAVSTELYLIVHVAVVALAFRRVYGLVKRRLHSNGGGGARPPLLRLLQAVLFAVLLFAQPILAALFAVLGPNPVTQKRLAAVYESSTTEGIQCRLVTLVDRGPKSLVVYDDSLKTILVIPNESVCRIELLPSKR